MPGYTHLQHDQPISFAHHLMVYYNMFQRDSERFEFNQKHTDLCPLGAAALAGTTFPIDRQLSSNCLAICWSLSNLIQILWMLLVTAILS